MEVQQVFDTIVNHLRAQGHQSLLEKPIDRGSSFIYYPYRGTDGSKCAAGALIADSDYQARMEGVGWNDVVRWLSNASELREHSFLIMELQMIHDQNLTQYWEAGFSRVAAEYNLTYTPPQAKE